MNIDNLTIGEAKLLAAMFGQPAQNESTNSMIGKKCIVRTYSAGVHFGEIAEKSGNEVILKNARRLWYWKANKSISLSGVAKHGLDGKSKVTPAVESIWLEAIELIPVEEDIAKNIEEQLTYPGQIRVTVIRETRAVEYAK